MKYSAAILMGGQNTRMSGENKALKTFQDVIILERMMTVIKPIFDEIIFVTNKNPEQYKIFKPTKITSDIIPGRGALSGIHSALKHCSNESCFIFACDMPTLDTSFIEQQISAELTEHDAVIPIHDNKIEPLHGIFKKRNFSELQYHLFHSKKSQISLFLNEIKTFYFKTTDQKSFININSEAEKNAWENKLASIE